ncbi:P-II family nitrogen regulator [Oscillospiraceae bacterium LTW-04]|nr:hypothetical protein RBH76_13655 [Oscillospiraceae bacterium MB24-C1]
MRLMVFVLNKTELLEPLLAEFLQAGISGATILESTGMARVLTQYEGNEIPFIGSIRALLNPERSKSETILFVIKDEQLKTAVATIEKVVGNIYNKDTGIIFSIPIDFVKGLPHLEL